MEDPPVTVIDERRAPLIHLRIEDRWDPRDEVRADAKVRLLAEAERQVEAELDRITEDAESRGYVFPDTSPRAGDYLRWFFEHVARGKTYPQIAEAFLNDRSKWTTVANRAKEYADVIGVTLGKLDAKPRFKGSPKPV